jgi:phytoene dehydrogenase-like protein
MTHLSHSGNGKGEWKVPEGGMGALVQELERVATSAGVSIALNSPTVKVQSDSKEVHVICADGYRIFVGYLLSNETQYIQTKVLQN